MSSAFAASGAQRHETTHRATTALSLFIRHPYELLYATAEFPTLAPAESRRQAVGGRAACRYPLTRRMIAAIVVAYSVRDLDLLYYRSADVACAHARSRTQATSIAETENQTRSPSHSLMVRPGGAPRWGADLARSRRS